MSNLNEIYGDNADFEKYKNRICNLKTDFLNYFKFQSADVFSSSGRIEILGNHTDHNKGKVLVGAIDQDIIAACSKRDDDLIIIKSKGFEEINFNVNDTEKKEEEKGKSISLIKGILKKLNEKGYKIKGINALTVSNVFKGAGVSSSAAFETLICKIFSYYYCNDEISPLENAKISQFAESKYFGKPCGLLDQSGIAFGGVNHIDFKDTINPIVTNINPKFSGFDIVITNCGGDHCNLTDEYAAITKEMKEVSNFFEKDFLREVPCKQFYDSIKDLKQKTSGRAILRAIHFYEENQRVDIAANALNSGDIKTFLDCVNSSGESSYKYLQNCYANTDTTQGIPLALKMSKIFLKDKGAVRVHGGGFAGTIIAFVPQEISNEYINFMQNIFGNENIIKVNLRPKGTAKIEL